MTTRARAASGADRSKPRRRATDDLIDEGIEKSLLLALAVLDDDNATPHTKVLASKLFYGPMMRRLAAEDDKIPVTPQEHFQSLMKTIRDVPAAKTIVTDSEIKDLPNDAVEWDTEEEGADVDAEASAS